LVYFTKRKSGNPGRKQIRLLESFSLKVLSKHKKTVFLSAFDSVDALRGQSRPFQMSISAAPNSLAQLPPRWASFLGHEVAKIFLKKNSIIYIIIYRYILRHNALICQ
jgi:hypothetical protein